MTHSLSAPAQRAWLGRGFLIAALAACAGEPAAPPGPPAPAAVNVAAGNGQAAPAGTALPAPIVATVLDGAGLPMPGVRVAWSAGTGRIDAITPLTGPDGRARARWVLGARTGAARAEATVGGLPPAVFSAVARPPDPLPPGEIRVLSLATYDGSGQVVHPDFARSASPGFAETDHLALTPYPFGNAGYENPSVFVADGRSDRWSVERDTPNPVVRPTLGYLSDPDLVFDPETAELRLYYRQATSDNIILLTRSTDGVHWGDPVEVTRRPSHEIVSPAVVRRGPGEWYMWSVNSGSSGCSASSTSVEWRRSADGLAWSPPQRVALAQPDLWPWHIDVQWIPERAEFWAVYNAKQPGSCTTPAVFAASSPDGVTWRVAPQPVLTKGRVDPFRDIVYRTSFAYEPGSDLVTFWYSGARYQDGQYVWSAAVERRPRAGVFAEVAAVRLGPAVLAPAPAPLREWP